MTILKDFFDCAGLTPEKIANETKISIELVDGLICGDINIMDVDIGTILLLCQYLKLPLSSFMGFCVWQGNSWQITTKNGMYHLSFELGNQRFENVLGPVTQTNTKYIRQIALVDFECFLLDIIEAKKGRVIEYQKRVELEMKKAGAPDWVITSIDQEEIENHFDVGHTPEEAMEDLLRSWRA